MDKKGFEQEHRRQDKFSPGHVWRQFPGTYGFMSLDPHPILPYNQHFSLNERQGGSGAPPRPRVQTHFASKPNQPKKHKSTLEIRERREEEEGERRRKGRRREALSKNIDGRINSHLVMFGGNFPARMDSCPWTPIQSCRTTNIFL